MACEQQKAALLQGIAELKASLATLDLSATDPQTEAIRQALVALAPQTVQLMMPVAEVRLAAESSSLLATNLSHALRSVSAKLPILEDDQDPKTWLTSMKHYVQETQLKGPELMLKLDEALQGKFRNWWTTRLGDFAQWEEFSDAFKAAYARPDDELALLKTIFELSQTAGMTPLDYICLMRSKFGKLTIQIPEPQQVAAMIKGLRDPYSTMLFPLKITTYADLYAQALRLPVIQPQQISVAASLQSDAPVPKSLTSQPCSYSTQHSQLASYSAPSRSIVQLSTTNSAFIPALPPLNPQAAVYHSPEFSAVHTSYNKPATNLPPTSSGNSMDSYSTYKNSPAPHSSPANSQNQDSNRRSIPDKRKKEIAENNAAIMQAWTEEAEARRTRGDRSSWPSPLLLDDSNGRPFRGWTPDGKPMYLNRRLTDSEWVSVNRCYNCKFRSSLKDLPITPEETSPRSAPAYAFSSAFSDLS